MARAARRAGGVLARTAEVVLANRAINPTLFGYVPFGGISPFVRGMSTTVRAEFLGQVAEEVGHVEDGDRDLSLEERSFRDFQRILSSKLASMRIDGMHKDGIRERVVGAYYDAFLAAEEGLIGNDEVEPFNVYDYDGGKIKFFVVESEEEKAKGMSVIAKDKADKVVGRMFLADAPGHHHLSIFQVEKGLDIREEIVSAHMVKAAIDNGYGRLEDGSLTKGKIALSCVGNYGQHLRRLAGVEGKYKIFGANYRLQTFFPLKDFAELAENVVKGEYTPIYEFEKPSAIAASPSAVAAKTKKEFIERE